MYNNSLVWDATQSFIGFGNPKPIVSFCKGIKNHLMTLYFVPHKHWQLILNINEPLSTCEMEKYDMFVNSFFPALYCWAEIRSFLLRYHNWPCELTIVEFG